MQKGIYKNTDPQNQPEGYYLDAKNMIPVEDEGSMTNELGTEYQDLIPGNNKIIGTQLLPDGRVIIFSTSGSLNEPVHGGRNAIGILEDGKYRELVGEPVVEKFAQIKHIVTDQGSQRTVDPTGLFNFSEKTPHVKVTYDLFFETVFTFNTIGQSPNEMFDYLTNRFGYSTQAANNLINSLNINSEFAATGFPYNVVKLFGVASDYDRQNSQGPTNPSTPRRDAEWSVRVSAIRGGYNNDDGLGYRLTHTESDAKNPNIGPTLALYVYDQSRSSGTPGRYYHLNINDFVDSQGRKGVQKNTWYTIELEVKINDFGQSNGIIDFKAYQRSNRRLLGHISLNNMRLHNSSSFRRLAGNFMFNTFFGGSNIQYTPRLDPNWETQGLVDVNNGVYSRITNIKVENLENA